MKYKLTLFSLYLLLFAQSSDAGSIFSRSGIGLIRYGAGASTFGMGGIGITGINQNTLPYLNPAGLAFFNLTRFEGSFSYENAAVDFPDDEARFVRAVFNSFQAVFPVKSGYSLGVGLQPYSDVSFTLSRSVEFSEETATETLSGSGGLQRGFIQFGGRLASWLAAGAALDVYFGNIRKTWRVFFAEGSAYANTRVQMSSYLAGVGAHTGILVRVARWLETGAVVYFPATLERRLKVTPTFNTGDVMAEVSGHVRLPLSWGYGVTFEPNPRFQAGIELFFQRWSDVDPDEFFSIQPVNTSRIASGLSYLPSTDPLAGFFSHLIYKLGFNTTTLPYTDGTNEQIRETVFGLGVGIPFNFNISRLDLGIEYGWRGDIDRQGAKETVLRMVVGITGGEKWFVRR